MNSTTSEDEPGDLPPPRRLPRITWVAVLVALDLVTKTAMFRWLARAPGAELPPGAEVWFNGHWRVPLIGDFLGLMLSENKGAAWGMGDEFPYLLVGGRAVAVVVLAVLLWRAPRGQWVSTTAFVLVLAGALGNLVDNLFRPRTDGHPFGAVRDFIHVYFERWEYHFPTFNVADSCITVGAVLLIVAGMLPVKQDVVAGEPAGSGSPG